MKIKGFTLVELLAVIAIIGIALVIAVPHIIGMTRGSGMNASVTELKSVLSLTRQWAITHREKTYVVFADGGHFSGSRKNRGDMAYHAYSVWGDRSQEYIREWSYLKTGVYFIPCSTKEKSVPPHSRNTKNPLTGTFGTLSLEFPDPGDSPRSLPAIGFRPDGTAVTEDNTPLQLEIYQGEGLITASVGRDNIGVNDLEFKPDGTVFGIEVSTITGGLRVRDYQHL